MKITELKKLAEPNEDYNVTQYYLVLDGTKQCITWWSQHYDELKVGDDVKLVEETGTMNWKVGKNFVVVDKVKLQPVNKTKKSNPTQSNPVQESQCDTEILRLALTHCHHMDRNDDYDIYRMYRLFKNIENDTIYQRIRELNEEGQEVR